MQNSDAAGQAPDAPPPRKVKLRYAGIGSRETPGAIATQMIRLAEKLAADGWELRSGGASGADSAFEVGSRRGDPRGQSGPATEIWLPWPGYNDREGAGCRVLHEYGRRAAERIAEGAHKNWGQCSQAVRKLHARNAAIILGDDLDTPVDAVVCWTPGGRDRGGTGVGLRIAAARGIPVLNLATTPMPEVERLLGLYARARRADEADRSELQLALEDAIDPDVRRENERPDGSSRRFVPSRTRAEEIDATAAGPVSMAEKRRLDAFRQSAARQDAERRGETDHSYMDDAYGPRKGKPIPRLEPAGTAEPADPILAAAYGTPDSEPATEPGDSPPAQRPQARIDYPLPGVHWWPDGDSRAGRELAGWLARNGETVKRQANALQSIFGEVAAINRTENRQTGELADVFAEAAGEASADDPGVESEALERHAPDALALARVVQMHAVGIMRAGGPTAHHAAAIAELPRVPARAAPEVDRTRIRPGESNYTGAPEVRAAGREALQREGGGRVHPDAAVHPTAKVDRTATLGRGAAVGAHSVVEAGALVEDARVGDHVIVGRHARVTNGSVVSAPGASDTTLVGARTHVVNATIGEGAILGKNVRVGERRDPGPRNDAGAESPDGQAPPPEDRTEVGSKTTLGDRVILDRGVSVGRHVVMESDTTAANGVVIDSHATVRHNCELGGRNRDVVAEPTVGKAARLEPGVALDHNATVADGVVVPADTLANRDQRASYPEGDRQADAEPAWAPPQRSDQPAVAITTDAIRRQNREGITEPPAPPAKKGEPPAPKPALVHPDAQVDPTAILGPGCVVAKGARVEAGARIGAGASIGRWTRVMKSATVGIDAVLDRHVTVETGAAIGQGVVLEHHVRAGAGARIGEGTAAGSHVQVGEDARVGRECSLGRGTKVGPGAELGLRVSTGRVPPDGSFETRQNARGARIAQAGCTIGQDAVVASGAALGAGAQLGRGAVLKAGRHREAVMGAHAQVGDETVIEGPVGAHAQVGARTTMLGRIDAGLPEGAARVGDDVQVGRGTLIEIESVVENGATLGENNLVARGTEIGKKVDTGAGVLMHAGTRVLEGAEVDTGAVLHRGVFVPAHGTVAAGEVVREENPVRAAMRQRENRTLSRGAGEDAAERSGAATAAHERAGRTAAERTDRTGRRDS